jgi:hypothetical protein
VLSHGGPRIDLIGSAGESGPGPERHIGIHESPPGREQFVVLGVGADCARMEQVEGADIEGRGDPDPRTEVDELLGEVQSGSTVIEA